MGDPMPIHARLDQVHQRAGTEVQEDVLIRAHQVACGGASGMHIGTGAKNGYAHGPDRSAMGYVATLS